MSTTSSSSVRSAKSNWSHIVDLRLKDLERLLADRNITIELTDEARHQLFMSGYDRAYGARPLKRAIQRLIQDPLAIKILDGEVLHGDHVKIDADPLNNQLKFEVAGTQRRSMNSSANSKSPAGEIPRGFFFR